MEIVNSIAIVLGYVFAIILIVLVLVAIAAHMNAKRYEPINHKPSPKFKSETLSLDDYILDQPVYSKLVNNAVLYGWSAFKCPNCGDVHQYDERNMAYDYFNEVSSDYNYTEKCKCGIAIFVNHEKSILMIEKQTTRIEPDGKGGWIDVQCQ